MTISFKLFLAGAALPSARPSAASAQTRAGGKDDQLVDIEKVAVLGWRPTR